MAHSHQYHTQSQGKIEIIALYVRALLVPRRSMILGKERSFLGESKLAGYQRISNKEPKRSTKVQNCIYSVFCKCKPNYHTNHAFTHLGPLLHLGPNLLHLGP